MIGTIMVEHNLGIILRRGQMPTASAHIVFNDWSREECEKATEMDLIGEPFSLECWCKTTPALLMVDAVYLTEKLLGKEMEPAGGNYETKAEAAQYYDTKATVPWPNNISRQDTALMLYRVVRYIEDATDVEIFGEATQEKHFSDMDKVSDYALEAVTVLAQHNILRGISDTELAPLSDATREQEGVLIYRCAVLVMKKLE